MLPVTLNCRHGSLRRIVTQIRAVWLSRSTLCGVKCSSVSALMSLCRQVKLTTSNPLRRVSPGYSHSTISPHGGRFSELNIQLNLKMLEEWICRKSQAFKWLNQNNSYSVSPVQLPPAGESLTSDSSPSCSSNKFILFLAMTESDMSNHMAGWQLHLRGDSQGWVLCRLHWTAQSTH